MSTMWDHDEAGVFVETLFAKHHGEIYAYLLRMLRDPELAADLTQDAFIKAYKNYDTLEKPENARAWLYQIAHRVALDEIRRRKIIRFFPWTGESRGSAPSAERLVMDAHLSGDMQRALARIPERQRAALLLAELHDLTGLELAAALGVSHVAARALLTRARESLRQALAAERAAEAEAEAKAATSHSAEGGADEPRPPPPPARRSVGRDARTRTRPRGDTCRLAARSRRGGLARGAPGRLRGMSLRRRRIRGGPPRPSRHARPPARSRHATCGPGRRPPSSANRRHAAAAREGLPPSRRRSIPLGALSGVAVIVVVIGASVLSGGFLNGPSTGPAGSAPPIAVVPTSALPGATPIAVGAGSVGWLGTSSNGGLAYNVTKIDEVCPVERQPDCEQVDDRDSKQVDLTIRPKSISQSPVKNQAVVVGTDASGQRRGGRHVPADAAPDLDPLTDGDAATPTVDAEPDARADRHAGASESATASASSEPSPSDTPSTEPSTAPSATPSASIEPSVDRPSPPSSRHPSRHRPCRPTPTVSTNLAIVSGVKVVGQSAAYSPDGAWFAFTRPPVRRLGRAGHLRLARRRPAGQRGHRRPRQRLRVVGRQPAHRQSRRRERPPATISAAVVLPRSGERQRDGHRRRRLAPGRRPDRPAGRSTWDGTVKVGRRRHDAVPGRGRARPARLLPTVPAWPPTATPGVGRRRGAVAEFDVRWDETGTWLAVWLADASDPSIGRLSLLHLDPVTGELDRPHGAPQDVTALPGFSIADGRLAWATPPGQGGEGSRVQIVAWTDERVGAVESGPVEDVVVIH